MVTPPLTKPQRELLQKTHETCMRETDIKEEIERWRGL